MGEVFSSGLPGRRDNGENYQRDAWARFRRFRGGQRKTSSFIDKNIFSFKKESYIVIK